MGIIKTIADLSGFNKRFHKYGKDTIHHISAAISPVEAKVAYVGKIDDKGILISKNNKKVFLKNLIGETASKLFSGGQYINFYLNPKNKHYWVTPSEGRFVYTQKNKGKALPLLIGLENLLGIEMMSKAVKRNASIGSIFQTKDFPIAMIAVGSLLVNKIHTDYKEKEHYERGTPCGYFSLGSSMLLCFPKDLKISVKKEDKVKIGQNIAYL
ncbi:phosphatidylserine decarboxylase [Nanoarchaeota archaeon]